MVRARNAPHAVRATIRLTSGSSLSVLLQRRAPSGKFVTVAKRATESPPGIKRVRFARHGRAVGIYRVGVRVPSNPRAIYVSRSVRRR